LTDKQFIWVTHQTATARWFKAELAQRAPGLKFAFARPGLSTFKVEVATPGISRGIATGRGPRVAAEGVPPPAADFILPSSFARAYGLSLGAVRSVGEVAEKLAGGAIAATPLRLHVWERDIDTPVDEQDPAVRGTRAAAVEGELRALLPGRFALGQRAELGEQVLDLIVPHATIPDEPWLLGYHLHTPQHGPWPGGVDRAPLPEAAPSRAWCKIEEAIAWGGLDVRAGETAVEIGASPGGAVYALLQRGLHVYGVDPAAMDEGLAAFDGLAGRPRFVHLRKPGMEVERRELPAHFQWLLMDANLAPMIALENAERYVQLGKPRGAVLTLKLNDDKVFTALPRLRERVLKLGARRTSFVQLPSHRSEICAILEW